MITRIVIKEELWSTQKPGKKQKKQALNTISPESLAVVGTLRYVKQKVVVLIA
jgi:hypothetical protein